MRSLFLIAALIGLSSPSLAQTPDDPSLADFPHYDVQKYCSAQPIDKADCLRFAYGFRSSANDIWDTIPVEARIECRQAADPFSDYNVLISCLAMYWKPTLHPSPVAAHPTPPDSPASTVPASTGTFRYYDSKSEDVGWTAMQEQTSVALSHALQLHGIYYKDANRLAEIAINHPRSYCMLLVAQAMRGDSEAIKHLDALDSDGMLMDGSYEDAISCQLGNYHPRPG